MRFPPRLRVDTREPLRHWCPFCPPHLVALLRSITASLSVGLVSHAHTTTRVVGTGHTGHTVSRKAGLASVAPGGRCVTDHYGKGTVRFVGTVTLGSGVTAARIGVELDAPRGKNDGTAFGVRYFRCRPDHGVFVLPSTLKMTHGGAHTVRTQTLMFTRTMALVSLSLSLVRSLSKYAPLNTRVRDLACLMTDSSTNCH